MPASLCLRCRTALRNSLRAQYRSITSSSASYKRNGKAQELHKRATKELDKKTQRPTIDIDALLSKPTWSVRSLLPSDTETPSAEITPEKLHHLLRLSALPQPRSPEEEASMLKTLHSQLHFLRDIQSVDTEGVEPLQSIRDETEEGVKERTIGLDTPEIQEALAKEVVKGRNRRPRRLRGADAGVVDTKGVEDWDVLRTAGRTEGKYFVVRSGKE